jgi:hypothetical protein
VATKSSFSEQEHLHSSKTLRLTQENLREATTSAPSNFLEPTTEKLSLSNKSEAHSNVTSDSAHIEAATASPKSLDSNSPLISNISVHHSKSTKLRGSSNSLVKTQSNSGGGIRVSGQKIEMPQLNNFFDHSEYLKKHEHGFR